MSQHLYSAASRRFVPQGQSQSSSAHGQRIPNHAPSPTFDLPMGSLYSMAAQYDVDMLSQHSEAAEQAMPMLPAHRGAGQAQQPARAPFFRPYQQEPSAHSHNATLAVRDASRAPEQELLRPEQRRRYEETPTLYGQQQHLLPDHMSTSILSPTQASSSPSPAFRGIPSFSSDTTAQGWPDDVAYTHQLQQNKHQHAEGSADAVAAAYSRNAQALAPSAPAYMHQNDQFQDQHRPPAAYSSGGATARAPPQPATNKGPAPRNRHRVVLRPVSVLPDAWRTIFKFPVFNAVQSTCFESVFQSERNLVVSAPTGSGKTVIFELAIIRMLQSRNASAKAVYLAPTKALCSERAKDWATRLQPLGCTVAEVTGDTSYAGLSSAKKARVIITTPEKWDSLTRRWSDHDKILANLALLLIDEVHILHEKERGARLEVIVSRMKNYGHEIRFVALSATVPNLEDVAEWIGRNASSPPNPKADEQGVPASFADLFRFGDEFRPCQLSKIVFGYPKMKDDFAFTGSLNKHLLGLVKEHGKGKPCLIFVSTRKGTVQAADAVAKEFMDLEKERAPLPWSKPTSSLRVQDPKLAELGSYGIAFHHAGMEIDDRRAVEQAFLNSDIKVLCATTTLATGVNLPAYCVIIRGTKQYSSGGWTEMSDLDFVQMIGRAGRPQFDSEGVAVIMTENDLKQHYIDLASGNTVIESSLAAELVEHVNAELVLRGTSSKQAIERWIEGTFLHVRLLKNPSFYNLDESAASKSSKEVMQSIVEDALRQLDQHELARTTAEGAGDLAATDFGDILAKYFLSFKTMLKLLEVPANATIKQLLEIITEAEELKDIRMRQGEKNLFTTLCKNEEIRFPPTKVNGVKEKISLLLQAVLAGMSLQECLGSKTAGYSPTLDAFVVFRHAPRIVRAMFDIFLAKRHGQALQNSFTLLRCINGRSWEAKPTILRQLDGVGEKTFKILSGAGMLNIRDVAACDPRRIEMLLNRNPPYGDKLVTQAKSFPHFHLDVEEDASERVDEGVQVTIKIRAGLDDTGVKVKTSRKESGAALSMCVLTMSSDLMFFDFRKMPLKKLTTDKEFKVRCTLSRPSQRIVVTAACDEIAGSAVRSELRHSVPSTMFPQLTLVGKSMAQLNEEAALQELEECIEFFDRDDELNLDLEEGGAGSKRVADIDASTRPAQAPPAPSKDSHASPKDHRELSPEPIKLPNGNYKCLHNCKSSCRHLCCREGMERPPHRKKGANKKGAASTERNVGAKGPAKAAESPSLLERFRALEDREASSNAHANKGTGTQASNAGSAKRDPQSQSTEPTPSTKPLTSGNRDEVFSESDDELPLIASRKRKYEVDWNVYDEDPSGASTSQNTGPKLASVSGSKKRRSGSSYSKFIDDEAGEDNRPEHATKGRAKQKRPKSWSMLKYQDRDDETELLGDLEEEDDAGSLQDFIVDDDVDLFATHSEEGDPERLSKGDLQDHNIQDDLAHLFSDSEDEVSLLPAAGGKDSAVTSKQSAPAAIDDEDLDDVDLGPCGDDGPLFFSEDAALGLDDAKPTTSPPSSPVQGPGRAQPGQGAGTAGSMQGFTKWFSGAGFVELDDDEEVVNEDMALGVRDSASPSPPSRRPAAQRAATRDETSDERINNDKRAGSGPGTAKTLTKAPAPAPAPAQVTATAPVMRRPTFADRKLAQLLQGRAAKSTSAATTSSAAGPSSGIVGPPTMPSRPTGGHVDGRVTENRTAPAQVPTGASAAGQDTEALAKTQAAPAQPAPAPAGNEEEEDIWADWDLLKA
ncbi:hypothetical protein V8E36_007618 [Tilletia maclaganii]